MDDSLQNLEHIDAERNDLIAKLAKIDEKRSTVSLEVFEKVKREYERKLRAIEQKIASNVELVKAELTRLKKDSGGLQQQRKDIELLIEEADLRYSIGEYDDSSYEKVTAEHKKKLEEIDRTMSRTGERMRWFESFATVPDQEPETEASEPEKLELPEPEPEPAPAPKPAPAPEEETLIEMQEIVEELKTTEDKPAEKVADAPGGLEIDEHILEAVVPEQVKKLDELLVEGDAVTAAPKPEPPKPNESAKIKKGEKGVACPKCGYVNAPDSWYCEKCGAEILETPLQ